MPGKSSVTAEIKPQDGSPWRTLVNSYNHQAISQNLTGFSNYRRLDSRYVAVTPRYPSTVPFYSGREAPSTKMGSLSPPYFFWGGQLPVFMLIVGTSPMITFIACGRSAVGYDMVQVAKNEIWVSEVCFAYLTWPYGLFLECSYHLRTHTPAMVDPN